MERNHPESGPTNEIAALGNANNDNVLAESPSGAAVETGSSARDELPPSTKEEILVHGHPSDGEISDNYGFVISYAEIDCTFPLCVSECVTKEQAQHSFLTRSENKRNVKGDPAIPPTFRAEIDYTGWPKEENEKGKKISKYQNGHLATASNHRYNRKAYDNTYFLSNIVPMYPKVNDNIKIIEWSTRERIKNEDIMERVYIITGPHFNPKRKPKFVKPDERVRVPDGIFKVVVFKRDKKEEKKKREKKKRKEDEKKEKKDDAKKRENRREKRREKKRERKPLFNLRAYYFENLPDKTKKTRIKLEDLKYITGLNFLPNIDINSVKEEEKYLDEEWLTIADILEGENAQIVNEVDSNNVDKDNPPDIPTQSRSL